jgi:predicted amidohydrolase
MAEFTTIVYIIDTDGSEAGFIPKMHIPDDPYFFKKNSILLHGDLGFTPNSKKEK